VGELVGYLRLTDASRGEGRVLPCSAATMRGGRGGLGGRLALTLRASLDVSLCGKGTTRCLVPTFEVPQYLPHRARACARAVMSRQITKGSLGIRISHSVLPSARECRNELESFLLRRKKKKKGKAASLGHEGRGLRPSESLGDSIA
jgi:hypothetical protein